MWDQEGHEDTITLVSCYSGDGINDPAADDPEAIRLMVSYLYDMDYRVRQPAWICLHGTLWHTLTQKSARPSPSWSTILQKTRYPHLRTTIAD